MPERRRHWQTRLSDAMIAQFRSSGQWRDGTSVERFARLVEADADALILIDGHRRLTRAMLWRQARGVAAALCSLGVEAGDVVSFQLPNWSEAAAIDLGAAMCGAIVNPIVPIYKEKELAHILNDCRARVIFVPEVFRNVRHAAMIEAMRGELPWLEHMVTLRPESNTAPGLAWDRLIDVTGARGPVGPCEVDANSLKLVMYTSGTTAAAKSVLHSHNTIDAEVRAVAEHYRLEPDDRIFMPSPITHITGYLYGIQLPLTIGAPAVFMDLWNKDHAAELIEEEGCRFTVGATPFLQELRDAAVTRGAVSSSLRYFLCGGAPVPPELIYDARRTMGGCLPSRVYGSTEAPTISLGPVKADEIAIAAETDGLIVGYDVKLLDAEGQPVADGEGEIAVRGPELFLGYGDLDRDAEAFDANGFFLTGDLGRLDARGTIVITGRKKDLIIRGGENISAKEIEDVLHTHPLIAEAAVIAMPHARLGETCCAVVALVRPGALSPSDIMAHVAASGLARQKIPEHVEFLDALPKTASGKIRKVDLRERIARLPVLGGGDGCDVPSGGDCGGESADLASYRHRQTHAEKQDQER